MRLLKRLAGKALYPFVSKNVGSVLRTWLAFGAGYLVLQGYATEELAGEAARVNYELIMGIIGVLFAQTTSLVEKKKRK